MYYGNVEEYSTYLKLRVGATSANLGPGFDCLGIALDYYDELEVWCKTRQCSSPAIVEVAGQNAPENTSNLIYRVLNNEVERLYNEQASGEKMRITKIRCHNFVPHARGLGSSSVALVGAIFAAKITSEALKRGSFAFSFNELKSFADYTAQRGTQIEGHADNVKPCCYGGLTFSADGAWWMLGEKPKSRRVYARDDLRLAAFISDEKLSTASARGVIPKDLPEVECEKSKANLVHLLDLLTRTTSQNENYEKKEGEELDEFMEATTDYIHQGRRSGLYQSSVDLMNKLRSRGVPAVISGAGPTVLALWTAGSYKSCSRVLRDADLLADSPTTWKVKYLKPSNCGVQILSGTIL